MVCQFFEHEGVRPNRSGVLLPHRPLVQARCRLLLLALPEEPRGVGRSDDG